MWVAKSVKIAPMGSVGSEALARETESSRFTESGRFRFAGARKIRVGKVGSKRCRLRAVYH